MHIKEPEQTRREFVGRMLKGVVACSGLDAINGLSSDEISNLHAAEPTEVARVDTGSHAKFSASEELEIKPNLDSTKYPPSEKYKSDVDKALKYRLITSDDRAYLLANNWEMGSKDRPIGNMFGYLKGAFYGYIGKKFSSGAAVKVKPIFDFDSSDDRKVVSSLLRLNDSDLAFSLLGLAGFTVNNDHAGLPEYQHVLDKDTLKTLIERAEHFDGTVEEFYAKHVNHMVKARLDNFVQTGFKASSDFILKSMESAGLPVSVTMR